MSVSLHEALQAIRRELTAAATDPGSPPGGYEPCRITLTLHLALQGGGGDPVTVGVVAENGGGAPSGTPCGPQLTVEFRPAGLEAHPPAPGSSSNSASSNGKASAFGAVPSAAPGPGLVTGCAEAFGPPGFDNAARAEVFCELASGVQPTVLQDALRQLANGEPGTGLGRRLAQLLGFAPGGPGAGALALLRLLEHHALPAVLATLSEHWRFGTHWKLPDPPAAE